jgi:hypothetical protein
MSKSLGMIKKIAIFVLLGKQTTPTLNHSLIGLVSLSTVSCQSGEETMDHRGINEQDIEKMMEGVANEGTQKEPTKEQTEEEKKLMQEWELHMHDFVPEDISTIIVDPRKEVVSIYFQDTCQSMYRPFMKT